MALERVTSRYASALIGLAEEKNVLEAVEKDMKLFLTTCNENRDLTLALKNPIILHEKKAAILDGIFGKKMNELTLSFFKIVSRKSRENILLEIAQQFETSPTMIRSSNGIKGNNIVAGKFLIIPVASKDPDLASMSADQLLARKPIIQSSNQRNTYTVKSGDSLWAIARKNSVSIDQITKWNKLKKDQSLKIGQTLVFYPNQIAKVDSSNEKVVSYKVKSGDSLVRIAARYKVTVADLIEWNSLKKNNYLQPGQMLKLLISNS